MGAQTQQDAAIIRLQGVCKQFDSHVVLDSLSLDIQAGKTTVIIGPSGGGKSVLLKHMIGLMKPDRGQVFFHEHEISAMPEHELLALRRRMGFLFQGSALFDSMTVEQNICFPLEEHDIGTSQSRVERARDVLAMVGLVGVESMFPEDLSGGQKRRVALARAIALEPEVIFYDEPTTGLDPIRADLINELISRLQRELRTTTIIVTHDMTSARKVADRIVMLYDGRFIADAAPGDLEHIDSDIVSRFIEGRASAEELAQLDSARSRNSAREGPDAQGRSNEQA